MDFRKIIDKPGSYLALATLLIAFFIIYVNSREFLGSFSAALMTAALVWATYIIVRWVYLAIWKA